MPFSSTKHILRPIKSVVQPSSSTQSQSPPASPTSSGYCGISSTGDPRVFGPNIWKTLHVMAQNFPDEPNTDTIENCRAFIKSLPYMLPCSQCGYHFKEFTEDYLDKNPDPCQNQTSLVKFFVDAHNNVSKNTNPTRLPWTVTDATEKYKSENVCFHNTVWGDEELCRDTTC